jgi:hypothetical protein
MGHCDVLDLELVAILQGKFGSAGMDWCIGGIYSSSTSTHGSTNHH